MFDAMVVAAISFIPKKWDLAANTRRLVGLVKQAARASPKPDLILAPEGVLEGYVVADIYENRVEADQMRSVALTDDSPAIQELRLLAAELSVCLAFGYAESVGTAVRNAAMFVDHTGKICGKYHKLQLAEGFVGGNWYNELGQSGRAFDTPLGRVGFLICNDRCKSATDYPGTPDNVRTDRGHRAK
jgi:predicted amidohydrolase